MPENTEIIPALETLIKDLNQPIREKEINDLPTLKSTIQNNKSQSIAKSFDHKEAFVPSRSHPTAPNKLLFETVTRLMTAPIDHLGDLFGKFPDDSVSPNPSTK